MMAMAILAMGLTALLETLRGGLIFASETENNIKAINIAREGMEAVMNIRDTNWLRFSSDRKHCWLSKDYSNQCISSSDWAGWWTDKLETGNYTIYPKNGVWYLSGINVGTVVNGAWSTTYKNKYKVWLDANGFFTQTGITATPCSSTTQKNCTTIFTREIQLARNGTGEVWVRSIAKWNLQRERSVILESTLTNWKSNF